MNFKKNNLFKISLIALCSLLFIQCDDDDDTTINYDTDYFVGIEYGSDGADYLSTAESLAEGTVSPVGNGYVQLAWASYIQGIDQVFSNAASTLTSYEKDEEGLLAEGLTVTTNLGIYAYDIVDESTLLAVGSPWYSTGSKELYIIDTDLMSITKTVETSLGDFQNATTGEYGISMPSSAKVIGSYLFVSYFLFDADGAMVKENEAHVAVYSYPGLELQKTISDDRASNIGRYYSEYGMVADEAGDIYTMSSSSFACGYYPVPTVNSGVLKINNGETKFDEDYYIDFETLSDGYKLNDIYYAKNGKAVVRILKDDSNSWSTYVPLSESPVLEFGILDLYNKKFTKLSGDMELSGGGWNGVALVEGNTVYVGVSNANYSGIYVIDVDKATVTEGADVDGNYAKAILTLISEVE